MTIEQMYNALTDNLKWQLDKLNMDWDCVAARSPIENHEGYGIVVWCCSDGDGKYWLVSIRENFSDDSWGKEILEELTSTDSWDELEVTVTQLLKQFYRHKGGDNTYGCDICGERKDWDYGIVWITSSYGVCYECYEKLSREDIEYLRKKYE